MSDTEDEAPKPEGPAKLGHRKVDPVTGEVAFKKVCGGGGTAQGMDACSPRRR